MAKRPRTEISNEDMDMIMENSENTRKCKNCSLVSPTYNDHLEHFKKCDIGVKSQQPNPKAMSLVICKHCSHESPTRQSYWAHLLECDVYLKSKKIKQEPEQIETKSYVVKKGRKPGQKTSKLIVGTTTKKTKCVVQNCLNSLGNHEENVRFFRAKVSILVMKILLIKIILKILYS